MDVYFDGYRVTAMHEIHCPDFVHVWIICDGVRFETTAFDYETCIDTLYDMLLEHTLNSLPRKYYI
jgi:hypothetical protein